MDENLTPDSIVDDAGQVGAESPQENNVATSEGESAVVAEQQTTEKQEKPQQTPEENAKYKSMRLDAERSAKAAEDKAYANLATQYGWTKLDGSPIQSKADYEQAVDAAQKRDALILQGKSQREAELEIQLEAIKQASTAKETQAQEQARLEREVNDFLSYFENTNGRKFTEADKKELEDSGVLDLATKENIPLRYVYADHYAKKQAEQRKAIEAGKKTQEANAANATTATGSVTGGGTAADTTLTEEYISKMSPKEMERRWPEIKKFYNMR